MADSNKTDAVHYHISMTSPKKKYAVTIIKDYNESRTFYEQAIITAVSFGDLEIMDTGYYITNFTNGARIRWWPCIKTDCV